MTGSWLSGPAAALPKGLEQEQDYPGQLLGLPEHGPGSLPATTRRAFALAIDWLMSMAIAAGIVGNNPLESPLLSAYTLIVWSVVGIGCVTLFSFTPGQFVAGLQVVFDEVDTGMRGQLDGLRGQVDSTRDTVRQFATYAMRGHHALMVHAPENEHSDRVMELLRDFPISYGQRYRKLVIEDIVEPTLPR